MKKWICEIFPVKFLAGLCFFLVVAMLGLMLSSCGAVETPDEMEGTISGASWHIPPIDNGELTELFDKQGRYQVGSAIMYDGLRIVFLDYDTDGHGYDTLVKLKEGYRIIRAYFKIENLNDTSYERGSNFFSCRVGDENLTKLFFSAKDSMPARVTLKSGESTEGWVYFEAPKNQAVFDVLFDSGDSPVFVIEGSIQLK